MDSKSFKIFYLCLNISKKQMFENLLRFELIYSKKYFYFKTLQKKKLLDLNKHFYKN